MCHYHAADSINTWRLGCFLLCLLKAFPTLKTVCLFSRMWKPGLHQAGSSPHFWVYITLTSSHIFQGAVSHPPNCCLWQIYSPFHRLHYWFKPNQTQGKKWVVSRLEFFHPEYVRWGDILITTLRCQQYPFSIRSKWQRKLWRLPSEKTLKSQEKSNEAGLVLQNIKYTINLQ